MFEGQSVIQATFRQKRIEGRKLRPDIAGLKFNAEGIYEFVGNEDQYNGVKNILSFHDVYPDHDPLSDISAILDLSLIPQGAGRVQPPAENYNDLDDLSEIKAMKEAERAANATENSEAERNGQSSSDQAPQPKSAASVQQRGKAAGSAAAPKGVPAGGVNRLGTETQVADDGPGDFDFS